MSRNIKIIRRRGIPYPPVEIQSLLIKHYLREKAICNKIRKLNRNNPSRTALLSEVYEIAHETMEKYVESVFLRYSSESKILFCKNLDKLFEKKVAYWSSGVEEAIYF